ncbi:hypothetical protein GQX73_g5257 [Xylaria multiplex]|uniref:Uncharacterized protein n=1 Tax=Xylaria multiplex TaxID=323545 RepID=A0A7C8INM7_9PEZI|nr:hypothetical protein GQX73_g5257 [Xylaria multiplex]
MKRTLRDHGSSTSTSNTPRASFPSVTANPPAPRSRRASDYPPLSHQTQIMKAVRRSAALPSLSLSIPPSPAQAMSRSEGSTEELSLAKEERAKTVTFSEPEDEELSDDSSICQSPSWEQYGQKKKKKEPKKGANQKSTKIKEDAALKKKSNRLIKSAPNDPFGTRPLTASDRSISAPELGIPIQSSKMNISSLTTEAQVALGKNQVPGNEPTLIPKDKRKSKGFLSGFKLQHGNVTAIQKLVDARKGPEKGAEKGAAEDEPLRSIQYETIPLQHHQNASRPRKAPSIRSVISTSDHSLSSQEKRSSGARTSTGSGHGRSQSLLSSTLNKLRGPSYLYYQPYDDGSTSNPTRGPDSSQEVDLELSNPVDMPGDRTGRVLEERSPPNFEHPQQPFDFAFSPKLKRMNTEPTPGPEIAPRGRQPRLRKVEIQSPDHEQDIAILRPSGGRRVQIEAPRASTRDAVMAMVEAQEKQSQAAYASQQIRSNTVGGNLVLSHFKGHQSELGSDGKRIVPRKRDDENNRSRNAHAINLSDAERLSERVRKAAAEPNKNDKVEISNGHAIEDDQISIDTYASTIRPASHQNPSSRDGLEPHIHAIGIERLEMRSETVAEKPVDDLITFERDVPDTLQQPLQPHREVDYFASFSDSYLPPVLNLRRLSDRRSPSPQHLSPEESDEDDTHGILSGHFRKSYAKQRTIVSDREQKTSHVIDSHPKESGRTLNEQKLKNSPATSTQYSDSDVPTFERLGLSSKAAKLLVETEMVSASTTHSQQTDPSRTTSERSSSSVCDDSPPSPSSATTPDSSRPQSRKGIAVSQPESSETTLMKSIPQTESGTLSKSSRVPFDAQFEGTTPCKTDMEADANSGDQRETSATSNPKQRPPTLARAGSLAISSSPVATPTLVSFAGVLRQDLDEEGEQDAGQPPAPPLPPRAHSALDLRSTTKLRPQTSRSQRLQLKPNAVASSVSLPSSPPADLTEGVMPRKSALKMSRNNSTNGPESSTTMSTGAAYLQEARKAAPVATVSSSRGLRPHFSQKNSSGSIRSVMSVGNRAEPLAKMLVECCNCHFFHDMPSRVYECMAKPDSVVEDKLLGVSAAITTMVRCPWCAHGMTTECCSGYAAVVYLKEKLHGK